MITKCDKPGCTKAGICRAPKNRDLNEYWYFCKDHAAEYNKNWDYYSNMTASEIEADWEKETFGTAMKDKNTAKKDSDDYLNFLNDFITGRSEFDKKTVKKPMPSKIVSALEAFGLPISATKSEISARYRILAKKYHPDTNKNKKSATEKFTQISNSYKILKEYYKK